MIDAKIEASSRCGRPRPAATANALAARRLAGVRPLPCAGAPRPVDAVRDRRGRRRDRRAYAAAAERAASDRQVRCAAQYYCCVYGRTTACQRGGAGRAAGLCATTQDAPLPCPVGPLVAHSHALTHSHTRARTHTHTHTQDAPLPRPVVPLVPAAQAGTGPRPARGPSARRDARERRAAGGSCFGGAERHARTARAGGRLAPVRAPVRPQAGTTGHLCEARQGGASIALSHPGMRTAAPAARPDRCSACPCLPAARRGSGAWRAQPPRRCRRGVGERRLRLWLRLGLCRSCSSAHGLCSHWKSDAST